MSSWISWPGEEDASLFPVSAASPRVVPPALPSACPDRPREGHRVAKQPVVRAGHCPRAVAVARDVVELDTADDHTVLKLGRRIDAELVLEPVQALRPPASSRRVRR